MLHRSQALRFAPSLAVAILCLVPWQAPAASREKEVSRTLPLDRDGVVSIDTYKGSVKISTTDSAEVVLRARIEADGDCDDRDERVAQTEIEVEASRSRLLIRSDYDGLKGRRWSFHFFGFGACEVLPLVHYTLTIPKTARLEIKDYKSRIDIKNHAADLELNTYKGSVHIDGQAGGVDLETYKGDVRVDMASVGKSNRFETYKGEIEISVPKSAAFTVDADLSRRGRLDADFDLVHQTHRRRHDTRARTEVNGGGPAMRLSTYKGEFRIRQR